MPHPGGLLLVSLQPVNVLPPPEGIRALYVFHIYLSGLNYFTWKILIAPVWMTCDLPAVFS